ADVIRLLAARPRTGRARDGAAARGGVPVRRGNAPPEGGRAGTLDGRRRGGAGGRDAWPRGQHGLERAAGRAAGRAGRGGRHPGRRGCPDRGRDRGAAGRRRRVRGACRRRARGRPGLHPLRRLAGGMTSRRSTMLFEQAARHLVGGVGSGTRAPRSGWLPEPVFVRSGEGAWLTDENGNRYLDYVMGQGPLILGHRPPAVIDAVTRTLEERGSLVSLAHD